MTRVVGSATFVAGETTSVAGRATFPDARTTAVAALAEYVAGATTVVVGLEGKVVIQSVEGAGGATLVVDAATCVVPPRG